MLKVFEDAYREARESASKETGQDLCTYLLVCEREVKQILEKGWLPD